MEITLKKIRDSYAHCQPTRFNDWEHFCSYTNDDFIAIAENKTQQAYDYEIKKQTEYKSFSKEQLLDEITKLRMELYFKIKE